MTEHEDTHTDAMSKAWLSLDEEEDRPSLMEWIRWLRKIKGH